MDLKVVKTILLREIRQWLSRPTGYIFLTLFIAASGAVAFLSDEFYVRNLADFALLNRWMPVVLLLFVPAATMNVWAEERRSGTDELLLTLPVRDIEVVLGKYLGAVGIFTIGLGFSGAHLIALAYLGSPDVGLMVSTYLGFWLTGVLFCSIGMLGSMLSKNSAVAFVLGFLGCGAAVAIGWSEAANGIVSSGVLAGLCALVAYVARGDNSLAWAAAGIGGGAGLVAWLAGAYNDTGRVFRELGVNAHALPFGDGIVELSNIIYFVGGSVCVLYLCTFMLGRRHWT